MGVGSQKVYVVDARQSAPDRVALAKRPRQEKYRNAEDRKCLHCEGRRGGEDPDSQKIAAGKHTTNKRAKTINGGPSRQGGIEEVESQSVDGNDKFSHHARDSTLGQQTRR